MQILHLYSNISAIGFENFRIFKNHQQFSLKPLTLFTGPNGSGKSTLQKVLILLASGIKRIDGGFADLDRIRFPKEYLEITGDYYQNLNFDSESNRFKFSFNFKDELFGKITAVMEFAPAANGMVAATRKLQFYRNGELVAAFDKYTESNNVNENDSDEIYGWRLDPKHEKTSLKAFRENLILFKNKINYDDQLIIIDQKIRDNEALTHDEELLKKTFQDKGYAFNQFDPEEELNDRIEKYPELGTFVAHACSIVNTTNNRLYTPKENTINLPDSCFIDHHNILIDSPLVDMVMGEQDLLSVDESHEWYNIKKALFQVNITTKDEFINAHIDFEQDYFTFVSKQLPESFHHFPPNGETEPRSFESFFEEKRGYGYFIGHPFDDSDFPKSSPILKILTEFNLIDLGYSLDKNGKRGRVNTERIKQDREHASFLVNQLTRLPRMFSRHLYLLSGSFVFSLQNNTVKRHYLISDKNVVDSPFLDFGLKYLNGYKKAVKRGINFVNKWVKEFGIAESLTIKPIKVNDELIGVAYFLKSGDKEQSLNDYGKGINQLLFQMLRIVSADRDARIMMEEPEVNLHPAFQSKLADMFVAASRNLSVKLIIETHSEYLIRRLQCLTAYEDQLMHQISINYLYHPEKLPSGKNVVEQFNINSDGSLEGEFGPGFFDEATNWKVELMRNKQAQKN
ncbi:MAG: AAA family ATPase [Marinilabiliaceae bacterium]|nr:AAA family ATPase [Marinilabiliaceae bacterium]